MRLRFLPLIPLFGLLLFCAQGAGAQSPPELTLEQAVSIALRQNRALKSGTIEVEKAGDRVTLTERQRWPVMQLQVQLSQLLTPVDFIFPRGAFGVFPMIGPVPAEDRTISTPQRPSLLVVGSVNQPLTQQYRIGKAIDLARTTREITGEKLRAQRQAVAAGVKRAYYAMLQTQSALDALRETLKYLRELSSLVQRYVGEGTALQADSLAVKARLAKAEHEALTYRNALASQREQLNHLLGRDLGTGFRVVAVPDATPLEADLSAARGRALERRPEVRESPLRVKQAELDVTVRKAEFYPDLTLSLTYLSPFNVELVPKNIVTAGLVFTWSPLDWFQKGRELSQKKRALSQARLGKDEAASNVLAEVGQAHRKLGEARSLLKVSQAARAEAQERLRVTQNRFAQKAALLKDVLEAQAALASADQQVQQSLAAFWSARAEFEKTIGEE